MLKLVFNKKRFIVICDQYGRLGNRLYLFAQFISFAKKENFEVFVPGFHDYIHSFKNLNHLGFYGNKCVLIPKIFSPELVFQAFNRLYRLCDLYSSNKISRFSFFEEGDGNPWTKIKKTSSKCILFKGFVFYDHMLECDSVESEIKYFFEPDGSYINEINIPFSKLRKPTDIVCGLLIRQTDYRVWNEGKYFFDTKIYLEYLTYVSEFFQNRKVAYFIATDENQKPDVFCNFNHYLRVGYPIENMYSLSKCDFLLGPPSSYIGWSSLYGQKPLFTIVEPVTDLNRLKVFLRKINL